MDIFRKWFGFSSPSPGSYGSHRSETDVSPFPEDHERCFNFNEGGMPSSNFKIFSDPLEMHRYFEQQMDSFFKSFGMPNFGHFFDSHQLHEDHFEQDGQEELFKHPREYYLKKGYEKPNYDHPDGRMDKDLDGKLSITDLDSVFKNPSDHHMDIVPRENHSSITRPFGKTFFGQSVQMKTIRNADGSYETHRTVTDAEGNQKTTVTQKLGDKEYTVVRIRNREGKEEVHETLINMTEDEKSLFAKSDPIKPLLDHSTFRNLFK